MTDVDIQCEGLPVYVSEGERVAMLAIGLEVEVPKDLERACCVFFRSSVDSIKPPGIQEIDNEKRTACPFRIRYRYGQYLRCSCAVTPESFVGIWCISVTTVSDCHSQPGETM